MRKAKEYLEQVSGIEKPLNLARKFNLLPKQAWVIINNDSCFCYVVLTQLQNQAIITTT